MTAQASSPCRHHDPEVLEVRTASGFDVKLDPTPLSALDELRAVMAGRATYTRHLVRGEVHTRRARTIRERPAGITPRQDVHAEHDCTRENA